MRNLTKNEKRIIELIKKADKIAANDDVNIEFFGQADCKVYILLDDDTQTDYEIKTGGISTERIAYITEHIVGNGGDADFRNPKTYRRFINP